jgi:radical SAM superfamily enzyme YgiQ (UPF0313 family)
MNILLVSPRTPRTFWSFCHVMPFIARRAAFPPLGLLTVAAMLPREWNVKLVDMNVANLSDADIAWADYVFLSGMIVHADAVRQVIARCGRLGKVIVAGGPLFTTGHERFPQVRHVVLGEAEDVIASLVADLRSGRLQPFYRSASRPDLSRTPIPRWDLLNMNHYATMALQFSRGCPFDCEFCDIIVMYGRVPRVKPAAQFVAELNSLVAAGWNGSVFIVDDNFIGHRPKAKELLRALIAWRRKRPSAVTFLTEASVNLARDDELLDLMARAGIKRVFVGLESPQAESLAECNKAQNRKVDLVSAVRRIHAAGIEVMGGFIVGFDSDRPDIFQQQSRFIQDAGVATAMVGLLTALPGTQLHARLTREGRVCGDSAGNNVDVDLNFVPKLDRARLIEGYRSLVRKLYTPRQYYGRILTFLRDYRPRGPKSPIRRQEWSAFIRSLWVMGVVTSGRLEYWKFLIRSLLFHRDALGEAMSLAIMGFHFRRVANGL